MITPKCQNALKYTLLTAAAGLIVVCWLALVGACGPSASSAVLGGEPEATPTPTIWWLGDTPSPSELATLDAIPTATPYPPGYIDPTDPPYPPPLTNAQIGATLVAKIATAPAPPAPPPAAPAALVGPAEPLPKLLRRSLPRLRCR